MATNRNPWEIGQDGLLLPLNANKHRYDSTIVKEALDC